MLSLARDPVGYVPNTDRKQVSRGGYVIREPNDFHLTLASCGSNLHFAVAAADILASEGISVRLVSAPSLDMFEKQSAEYKASVFPLDDKPVSSAWRSLWPRSRQDTQPPALELLDLDTQPQIRARTTDLVSTPRA
jgi:transketolase